VKIGTTLETSEFTGEFFLSTEQKKINSKKKSIEKQAQKQILPKPKQFKKSENYTRNE
jgi:hypothetical protein